MPDLDAINKALEEAHGENVQIRHLSPPEFIKAANAREHKAKHSVDLHHFFAYLQGTAGLLRELPAESIDTIVNDYLTIVEPKDV